MKETKTPPSTISIFVLLFSSTLKRRQYKGWRWLEPISSEIIRHQVMLKETFYKLRILIPSWHIMVSIVRHDNRAMLHCMIHNVDIFILLNSVECMRLSHFLQELDVVWPLALSSYSKPYCDLRSWSFYEWWTEKKSYRQNTSRSDIRWSRILSSENTHTRGECLCKRTFHGSRRKTRYCWHPEPPRTTVIQSNSATTDEGMSMSLTKLPKLSKSLRDSELETVKNTSCLLSFPAIHPSNHPSYPSFALGDFQRVLGNCSPSSAETWPICSLRAPPFRFSVASSCPSPFSPIYRPFHRHVSIFHSSDWPREFSFRVSLSKPIARSWWDDKLSLRWTQTKRRE